MNIYTYRRKRGKTVGKSSLLINEPPLQVIPTLAAKIGLNEAIALQQLHYWLLPDRKPHMLDGVPWVYNSAEEWHKQFPFWSIATIWRVFDALEKLGLVQSDNFNRSKFDRTKWYTVRYDKLLELDDSSSRITDFIKMNNGSPQDELTIPETTTETTTERVRAQERTEEPDIFQEEKANSQPIQRVKPEEAIPLTVSSIAKFEAKKNAKRAASADPRTSLALDEKGWAEGMASVAYQSPMVLSQMLPQTARDFAWKAKELEQEVKAGKMPRREVEAALEYLRGDGGANFRRMLERSKPAKAYQVLQALEAYVSARQKERASEPRSMTAAELFAKDEARRKNAQAAWEAYYAEHPNERPTTATRSA